MEDYFSKIIQNNSRFVEAVKKRKRDYPKVELKFIGCENKNFGVMDSKIYAKFEVIIQEEHKLLSDFYIRVMKNGEWNLKFDVASKEVFTVSKDYLLKEIIERVSMEVFRESNANQVTINHQFYKELTLKIISEALKKEVQIINERITELKESILKNEEIKSAALKVYEDVARVKIQEVLSKYKILPPESLHRMVDEMYVKSVIDS